ncbi:hypothetical protein Tco_1356048, partial [Tanacetum coccineum]
MDNTLSKVDIESVTEYCMQDISHHDAEKDEYLMTLIRMPTAEEVINSFYKKNPGGFMDMDIFDNEVDIFLEKEKRKLMNLKCSENISLCNSEDKREVMEKDNEAVVLDMNIKIADAVKPGVDADVNDAVTLDEVKDMNNVSDMYNKRRVGDLYEVESNISELGTTDAG